MAEWLPLVLFIVLVPVAFGLALWEDARFEAKYRRAQRERCPVCSGSGSVLLEMGPPAYGWCPRHVSLWYSIERLEAELDRDLP